MQTVYVGSVEGRCVTGVLTFVPLMLQQFALNIAADSHGTARSNQKKSGGKALATKQSTAQCKMIPSTRADTQGHKAALIASA